MPLHVPRAHSGVVVAVLVAVLFAVAFGLSVESAAAAPAPAAPTVLANRANPPAPTTPGVTGRAAAPAAGYWLVGSDGGVFAFGDAPYAGSTGGRPLDAPVVGMAATSDGHGYWLVAADGGVFAFGDAPYLGSTGDRRLAAPVVGMAATPDGRGYWLVAADGGVFAFGDAPYLGSTGDRRLAAPVVGMASTPDGHGYWLVGSDGGVFTFGDAPYAGSVPALGVNRSDIVGLVPTSDGAGYALTDTGGTSWAFGDATPVPSLRSLDIGVGDVRGITPTTDHGGYWLAGADGGVFGLGDAAFAGSLPALGVRADDIVGIAAATPQAPPTAPSGGSSPTNPPVTPPGPAWSPPVAFDPSAAGASAVSCADPTFCAVVDGGAGVWTWSAGTWSGPVTFPGDALNAVSCATSAFCIAAGSTTGAPLHTAAVAFDGSSWSAAPGFTAVATFGGLLGVSCPTTAFCAAVGDGIQPSGTDGVLAEVFDGASWSVAFPPGPEAASDGGPALHAVSCADAQSCAAVGAYTSGPSDVTFIEDMSGSTWSVAQSPPIEPDSSLPTVSCPTALAPVPVTAPGTSSGSASGTAPTTAPPSVSCTAVGTEVYPRSPNPPTGLVEHFGAGAWNLDPSPPASPLWSVSCSSPSACTAGGPGGIVVSLTDGVWSAPQEVDGANIVTSVSCLPGGFCMATDNAGRALTTSGG
jgi:hypothetical protein